MLSKNNYKERLRKMESRQDRFSIRKFSIGAASVLIGFFFIGMSNGEEVNADRLATPDQNDDHPEQASGQRVDITTPKKVIVDQKVQSSFKDNTIALNKNEQQIVDSNKAALKQNTAEKVQAETSNKGQTSQKTQGEIKQTPSAKTSIKSADSKETTAENSQQVNTVAQKLQQSAVKNTNQTAVANSNVNQAKTENTDLTDKNISKLDTTNNKNQIVKNNTEKASNGTVDPELAAFKKEYQDLQTNFDKLSIDERTQRAAKVQADYEKMGTQAKTQFALANGVNQQLYSVNNGVADVSTFADFTKALCDKNVTTINMTGDITAADNQSALVSGTTSSIVAGLKGLKAYE
ncbi:MAG: YSIRK-type signal peptide-containing protein, partial [Lactobacillus sp.]|nr:YSIRK-type signal peptide-containing protein [Lactobacillus sp.]